MATISAFAGSSGRVKMVAVAISTTTDVITFTGTPATISEFMDWAISYGLATSATVMTFESDANSQNVLHPQQLAGGTAQPFQITCKAAETAVLGVLQIGSVYLIDCILQKGSNTGRKNIPVKLSDIKPGTGVDAPSALTTLTFSGSGILPPVS